MKPSLAATPELPDPPKLDGSGSIEFKPLNG